MRIRVAGVVLAALSTGLFAVAQETASNTSTSTAVLSAASAASPVPRLVRFAGVAKDADDKNMSGTVGITFLLYKDQQGGAPLWMETQNVQADSTGRYSVQLGATKPDGLPTDVFTSGEARWLAVQISGQSEQPRVLLLSVPYALKAADAETIGGLPPSAFVKATPAEPAGANADGTSAAASLGGTSVAGALARGLTAVDVTTTGGVKNDIPLWTTTKNIQSSIVSQTGTTQINVAGSASVDSGNTNTGTETPGLRFGNSISGEAISSPRTGSTNVFGIDFYTGNARHLSITNSGDLGIGTVTPAGALHIVGPAGAPPSSQPAANNGLVLGTNGTSSYKWVQTFGGPLALNPTGNNVGVGTTTPTHTLEVNGNGNFSNGVSGGSSTVGASAVYGNNSATSGSGTNGMYGSTSSPAGAGMVGVNFSTGGSGVYGQTYGDAAGTSGVVGIADSTSGSDQIYGVYGQAANGVGVYGQHASRSSTGSTYFLPVGVWADGGSAGVGLFATADSGNAGLFMNDGTGESNATLYTEAQNSNGFPFVARNNPNNNGCWVDNLGNINCTGSKNAVVPVDGGAHKVALSAIESPKNWFEDFGSAQLSSGAAVVAIDPEFLQTVNTETDYMVIPVPNGECKGLYVTNKKPASFEVREMGGGTSSIRFDYRIVVLRKNYENVRFADHTKDEINMGRQRLAPRQPAEPQTKPASTKQSALIQPR